MSQNTTPGSKTLSPNELEKVAQIRATGEIVKQLIDNLEKDDLIDKRFLSVAKTDLQKGFMSLVRSIAKPDHF